MLSRLIKQSTFGWDVVFCIVGLFSFYRFRRSAVRLFDDIV
jgi:hypothetical protein